MTAKTLENRQFDFRNVEGNWQDILKVEFNNHNIHEGDVLLLSEVPETVIRVNDMGVLVKYAEENRAIGATGITQYEIFQEIPGVSGIYRGWTTDKINSWLDIKWRNLKH